MGHQCGRRDNIYWHFHGIADYNIDYVKIKGKKITFIIVNNNNNSGYNYTENANCTVAMFNNLLSRFSKARKIKRPSFLQTEGSTVNSKPPTIPFGFVACTFSDNLSRNSCIQVMLSIAVKSASIIWNVTPIASTMTVKAEFIDGQRCWDVS